MRLEIWNGSHEYFYISSIHKFNIINSSNKKIVYEMEGVYASPTLPTPPSPGSQSSLMLVSRLETRNQKPLHLNRLLQAINSHFNIFLFGVRLQVAGFS